MKRELVREILFEKHYDGYRIQIPMADIPEQFLKPDEGFFINIEKTEAYQESDHGEEDNTTLYIGHYREENDQELYDRMNKIAKVQERDKEARYKRYLELKKEFEYDTEGDTFVK